MLPVADLFAAAFIDVGMIVHLSKLYGLPLSEREAGSLVRIILAESAALMGTVWAFHFVSSALKVGTGGLSTVVTAGAQGAIAYYSTYLVGRIAGLGGIRLLGEFFLALEMIGDPGAIPALREVAEGDSFQVVRSHAAKAVERLSQAA